MNCIIIEDEEDSADHLEFLLKKCDANMNVTAKIDSVKGAVQWLKNNTTDLIFLDIQLGDGLCFSIFDNVKVTTPVIFTTSFNKYAIQAFKLNSLAYLLKPVEKEHLQEALDKYDTLYRQQPQYESLGRMDGSFQKRFLVEYANAIHTISTDDIAYFTMHNKHLYITHDNGEQFIFDAKLEALEAKLDPELFFRINRQSIIHIKAIHKMSHETRGRVRIETKPPSKEEMIVSIERATDFKSWLNR